MKDKDFVSNSVSEQLFCCKTDTMTYHTKKQSSYVLFYGFIKRIILTPKIFSDTSW